MKGSPLVAKRVTAKLNGMNLVFMHVSHKLRYIVNWKQNVNNMKVDSCNGSQPEILESKEPQKAENK